MTQRGSCVNLQAREENLPPVSSKQLTGQFQPCRRLAADSGTTVCCAAALERSCFLVVTGKDSSAP